MKIYTKKATLQGIPIVPMLDILTILLIFFIVHTEFKRKINVLQLDLPKTENIVGDVGEQHHILLELDSSGRIALDGHEISEHEIPSSVENLLREHPDAQLQFAAADGSSMGNFIRILDSLSSAGLDIEQIPVRINPNN